MTEPKTETVVEIDEAELKDVSGGAAYIKFDGVDGEVVERKPTASGVNVLLGDGSVRIAR